MIKNSKKTKQINYSPTTEVVIHFQLSSFQCPSILSLKILIVSWQNFPIKADVNIFPFLYISPQLQTAIITSNKWTLLQFVKETEPPAINSSIFMHLLFPTHIPYFCNIFSFSLPIAFFSCSSKTYKFLLSREGKKVTFSPLFSFYFSVTVTFQRMVCSLTLLHLVYLLLSMSSPTPLPLWIVLLISTAAQARTSRSQLLFAYFLTVSIIFNIAL